MAAVVELLPVTKISAESEWIQPTDSVVDVSAYTEAAIMFAIHAMDVNGGSITVDLQTAIDNREDHYVTLAEMGSWSSNPGELPAYVYKYLHGSTTGSSDAPGFARFLRIYVQGTVSGWYATIGIQALMKP